MRQWREAKTRHPDALLFFRVGDFYELFHGDAEEGARLLGLRLTARNNGAAAAVGLMSLMPTISISVLPIEARNTLRPMRPNPLIATFTAIE